MQLITVPYDYQRRGARAIRRFGGRALLADQQGLGKAQPLSSSILTPTGWVRMSDIRPGDPVMGSDGMIHHVTGVFPQGTKDVYKITFRDGVSVRCCDDHLWSVTTPNWMSGGKPPKVFPLKELRKNFRKGNGNAKWYVRIAKAMHFPHKKNAIPPYLLGYLLANGSLTIAHRVTVSIPDDETVMRLGEMLPAGITLNKGQEIDFRVSRFNDRSQPNPLTQELRRLGLMGKGFADKFIPHEYLYTSLQNRLDLFRGLMDGDGSCSCRGIVIEYSTGSQTLAKQVQELVWSFGGVARVKSRIPHYHYKGERLQGAVSYRVNISLPGDVNPFLLSRKADAVTPRSKYQPVRIMTDVVPDGREECQCISVDAPDHLYITDGYIPTHNTVQALMFLERHQDTTLPAVVICPASLKLNWQRELRMHVGGRCDVLEGTKPPKKWKPSAPITVINYDILQAWLPALMGLRPKTVIMDECQAIKSRTTRRTKCARTLCQGVPNIVGLSGTPITNRPAEMFPILNILRPDLFPNYNRYALRYCNRRKRHWGWDDTGSSNLQELHQILLDNCMIRRLKTDVLPDLPEKRRMVVTLPMSDPKQYRMAQDHFLQWLAKTDPTRVFSAARAEKLTHLHYLKGLVGRLKIEAVCDWVENFMESGDGKLILFAVHHEVMDAYEKRFSKECIRLDGNTSMRNRDLAVQRFQHGRERLFLGNIQAAGKGLTLTAASTVAFAEMGWTPGEHAQAEDRAHRIGQHSVTDIYYLTSTPTVESHLLELLQTKQGTIDSLLDGGENPDELDIYDQLCKRLLGE